VNVKVIQIIQVHIHTFRPLTSIPQPVNINRNLTCRKSNLVSSALTVFNDWISKEINVYENTSTIEIDWIVGLIPIDDHIGKELIIRYDTNIQFVTVFENVSANYYSINSRILILNKIHGNNH